MCKEIIEKSRGRAKLSPDEVIRLYNCRGSVKDLISETARELKEFCFGSSITLSAPLKIVGNESESEILLAARALADIGHKRLILELPETFDAVGISEFVRAIYKIENKSGRFHRIDISVSSADTEDLRKLKEAGVGTVSVKTKPNYNLETVNRVIEVFGEVGIDIFFDDNTAESDLEALATLAERSDIRTVSLSHDAGISEIEFTLLWEIVRLALPCASIRINASEPEEVHNSLARTCATGFSVVPSVCILDEVVNSLTKQGILSSFCCTCGHGDRRDKSYSELCAEGKLRDYCFLNALLSMKEYISDFASMDTRIIGTDVILSALYTIGDAGTRSAVVRAMKDIRNGVRGLRF